MAEFVEVEITPTPAQYRQLAKDLATLRARGADSNTQAILDAVCTAAGGGVASRQ